MERLTCPRQRSGLMSNPPEWIVKRAESTSEALGIPFHHAIQLEIETAMEWYGYPLPDKDPATEAKRKKAMRNHRVLDCE